MAEYSNSLCGLSSIMLLTVNYHYIRNQEDSKYPGIHGISPKRLNQQLEFLGRHFSFIEPHDLRKISRKDSDEKFCLITFDDGLKEQYEHALHVLDKHHVKGIFFVNGINTSLAHVSQIHKIHWLRSKTEPFQFSESLFLEIEKQANEPLLTLDQFQPSEGQNIYDQKVIQYAKYLLFHELGYDIRDKVIDKLYSEQGGTDELQSQDLYMNVDMLRDLHCRECLGSHSWSHDRLESQALSLVFENLKKNQIYFRDTFGNEVALVSYPFGGKDTVSVAISQMAKKVGHDFGFTIERAINTEYDKPLLLARLDANDIPHGKNPLFEIRNNCIEPEKGLTMGSTWFRD